MANKKQNSSTPNELAESPADLADEYLKSRGYIAADGLWLRRHQGHFLRYDGRIFRVMPDEELKADIMQYFRDTLHRKKLKTTFVNEVVQQLISMCLIPGHIELPARQREGIWASEPGVIVLQNGLIDLANLKGGSAIALLPHTPALVSRVCLPYAYDAGAECPQWQRFLEQILPDEGSRLLLQQIFGYCLTYDLSQQKFFMFEGSGGNGKGVVTNILTRVLGSENVSALSLHRFGAPHDLVVTLGKLANITTELKATDKVAEHILKQFTGNDAITFNPKYKDPFSAKPTAKIILSTNERPQFTDRSDGVWRRLIIVPFSVTIPEEQRNVNLEEELAEELPGILNWAIQGAYSLYQAGRFHEPACSLEARTDFRRESNPAGLFLEEHCYVDSHGQVGTSQLYRLYQEYCGENGYMPLNAGNFKKEVLRNFKGVQEIRQRGAGGYCRFYSGMSISPSPLEAEGYTIEEWERMAPVGA